MKKYVVEELDSESVPILINGNLNVISKDEFTGRKSIFFWLKVYPILTLAKTLISIHCLA